MSLPQEKQEELLKKLSEKGVKGNCPMCGNTHFMLADSYFNTPLQESLKYFNISGKSIPTIPIVCTNCGFVSQHALGVLGLLPKPEGNKNENEKPGTNK